jgi:hypothetical protein
MHSPPVVLACVSIQIGSGRETIKHTLGSLLILWQIPGIVVCTTNHNRSIGKV